MKTFANITLAGALGLAPQSVPGLGAAEPHATRRAAVVVTQTRTPEPCIQRRTPARKAPPLIRRHKGGLAPNTE